MPYKISRNKILEDFERYAYIVDLIGTLDYRLSPAEDDDFKMLRLKYKFLR